MIILQLKNLAPILKILVTGPESTGKSTLSRQLAQHFETVWVPEYARTYIEKLSRPYVQDDLWEIAQGQILSEKNYLTQANKLLICDTDLNVIRIWSEHKYGNCDARILEGITQQDYKLTLLCDIDMPWVFDSQREHPDPAMRHYFFEQYKTILEAENTNYIIVSGNEARRLNQAIKKVTELLTNIS